MSVVEVRPVVDRISDVLFRRLQLLTAGYSVFTPVVEVIRPTRMGGFTPQHLQIVLTMGDKARNTELDCPGNPPAIAWDQTFNIRCHVMPSERDTTRVDEIVNAFAADVMQVVCDAGSQWHTFDGLAIESQWQDMQDIDADGSFVGVNVPITITFRTDENNPFNVRA